MTEVAPERAPIVALGPVDTFVIDRLRPFGDVIEPGPGVDLGAMLPKAIGLIARGDSVIDASMIQLAARLQVIARSGVGVERVDLVTATARGIPVVITPGAGTNAVAEGALAHMLYLVKRLGEMTNLVREGRWSERMAIELGDLDGATLGIVGFGRIGRRLAQMAMALDMRIVAYDPHVDAVIADSMGVECVGLADLARRADVISLHAPLTAETARLIDREVLALVRPGTILVNCGRGGLMNLDAVHEALLEGRLAGVGLDVYDPEPPTPEGHPIFGHPNVVLTPHVLGLSRLGRRRTFEEMVEGMEAVFTGGNAPSVANPEIYARR